MYQSIQGNLGLGKAINYFTSHNYCVALPLNDTQKYDLIVDINNHLFRVSVKSCRYKNQHGSYEVMLKNAGGTSKGSKLRPFDNTTCDYVFIYTADNNLYLIPSNKIEAKNSITVGKKYTEYLVYEKTLSQFDNEMRE